MSKINGATILSFDGLCEDTIVRPTDEGYVECSAISNTDLLPDEARELAAALELAADAADKIAFRNAEATQR